MEANILFRGPYTFHINKVWRKLMPTKSISIKRYYNHYKLHFNKYFTEYPKRGVLMPDKGATNITLVVT